MKKVTNLTRLSRLDMKTAIAWHYRTTISLAPKRGFASCKSKKCLPKGRQRAFHLLFKFSRIEGVLEAPRAGGPVRVGLCRDSAPVHDETQRGLSVSTSKECGVAGPAFLTYFYVRLSGINVCKVIRVKIRRRSCQKSFLSPEVQIRIIWSA